MAQNLPPLPPWEQVSTNVIRILGGNPSKFTLQGTNTYLLGRGERRLLIDTGQGEPAWVDTLRTVLQAQSPPATVSTCLLTHWHHDHIGGVKDLESLVENVRVYKNQPTLNPDGLIDPDRVIDITDGQRFKVSSREESSDEQPDTDVDIDFEIEAIHTPGHAKDHMSFLVTKSSDPEEVGAIFTADNVLGHGTAVFEDLGVYLDSLALMKKRVLEATQISQSGDGGSGSGSETTPGIKKTAFPGHGAVISDSVAKIDEYIAHRRMREEEALNVLRFGTTTRPESKSLPHDSITRYGDSDDEQDGEAGGGNGSVTLGAKELTPGKEWTSMDMVRVIYRHYPENLYLPAEYGLVMVLEKLAKDGKVVKTPEGKWRASEKAAL
ncbi:hypothetical protein KCU88_g5838, partial [Aureobasidium melanogenum]